MVDCFGSISTTQFYTEHPVLSMQLRLYSAPSALNSDNMTRCPYCDGPFRGLVLPSHFRTPRSTRLKSAWQGGNHQLQYTLIMQCISVCAFADFHRMSHASVPFSATCIVVGICSVWQCKTRMQAAETINCIAHSSYCIFQAQSLLGGTCCLLVTSKDACQADQWPYEINREFIP